MNSESHSRKKQTKTLIVEVENLAKQRNHKLIDYQTSSKDKNTIPQLSYIELQCQRCNHQWKTRLQVYKERTSQSSGCRNCYTQNLQNPNIYPNSPFRQKPEILHRPKRREGVAKQREAHQNGRFSFLQNRTDLLNYFKNDQNKHNIFVFRLLCNTGEQESRQKNWDGTKFTRHHIIPLHAQGSPDSWNILIVTKEEHDTIHRLRYEVYREEDRKAMYVTNSDLQRYSTSSSEEEENQKPCLTTLSPSKEKYLQRRTAETLRAIENGMIWKHKEGFLVRFEPNSVQTIEEIRQKLCENLPENHPDRARMEKNATSSNSIREHINKIFEDSKSTSFLRKRNSAYGFTVSPLVALKNK